MLFGISEVSVDTVCAIVDRLVIVGLMVMVVEVSATVVSIVVYALVVTTV